MVVVVGGELKAVAVMGRLSTISTISVAASRSFFSPSRSRYTGYIARLPSASPPRLLDFRSLATTMNGGSVDGGDQQLGAGLEAVFKEKRILRSKVRKSLRSMDPLQRSLEGIPDLIPHSHRCNRAFSILIYREDFRRQYIELCHQNDSFLFS